MDIGILTYHRSHNYGAVLQVYALKKFLEEKGHKVKIVDYWPEYRKGMYDLYDFSFLKDDISLFKKIGKTGMFFLKFRKKAIRYDKFEQFIKEKFNVSSKTKISEGKNLPDNCDLYIYGSDQIWRYNQFRELDGFDATYWGDFPKSDRTKKITYAASMGVMDFLEDKHMDFISNKLINFQSISVREKELKGIVAPLTKKPITQVLDPVFLLSNNEWLSIEKKVKTPPKYVLVYNLLYKTEVIELAQKVAGHLNCEVVEITGQIIHPFKNSVNHQQTIGPGEYLYLFRNAEFVISSSFHGVAFSILFEKQFYAMGMGKKSSRVRSLLEVLKIAERLLTENSSTSVSEVIDYNSVKNILESKVNDSIQYINNSITKKNH